MSGHSSSSIEIKVPWMEIPHIKQKVHNLYKEIYEEQTVQQWLTYGQWCCDEVLERLRSAASRGRIDLDLPAVHCDQDLSQLGSGNVLGAYDSRENCILLDKSLSPGQRLQAKRAWVFWHELMHWLLHRQFILSNVLVPTGVVHDTDDTLTFQSRNQLEWQANKAASFASAPEELLKPAFQAVFRREYLEWIGPRLYWVQKVQRHHESKQSYAAHCGSCLTRCFGGLSGESIGYRLIELKLIRGRDDSFNDLQIGSSFSFGPIVPR